MTTAKRPISDKQPSPRIKVTEDDCRCLMAVMGVSAYRVHSGISNRAMLGAHLTTEIVDVDKILLEMVDASNKLPSPHQGFNIAIVENEPLKFPYLHASQLAIHYYRENDKLDVISSNYVLSHDRSNKNIGINLEKASNMLHNDLLTIQQNGLSLVEPKTRSLFKKAMWHITHPFKKMPTPEEEAQAKAPFVESMLLRAGIKTEDKPKIVAEGEKFAVHIQSLMSARYT